MNRFAKTARNLEPEQIASSSPEQIKQALDQALQHHAAGHLPEAERIYKHILQGNPDHPIALQLLGLVAHQGGNDGVAVDFMTRALAIAPDYIDAHVNLGAVYLKMGRLDEAAESYRKALALKPDFAEVHYNLANVLRGQDRLVESVAAYETALEHRPDYGEAMNNLGSLLRYQGRLREAQAVFDRHLHLRHGGPWWNASQFDETVSAYVAPLATPVYASIFKLGDCIDQLEYLIAKGRIDPSFQEMAERYRSVLIELLENPTLEASVRLSADQLARIGSFYDRVIHYPKAPRLAAGVINQDLDFAAIEDEYLASPVSAITFEHFLTPEALKALRDYCLESTIFFTYTADRHVSSSNTLGFNCDLLYQMAEELKEALPRVLDGHALRNMWVYRHNNQTEGVGTHTEDGSVTFNFWITPDDANLSPDNGGGLTVWVKEFPLEWDWRLYNEGKYNPTIKRKVDDFLSDAESFIVPYGENRATLFNSDLFHKSNPVNFKGGFENRRMNVTMLFGQRGA